MIESVSEHHTMSAADIDIDLINRSLSHVNNFAKRRQNEKLLPVLMYEIPCDGESFYRTMTLRELLGYVNDEASAIDQSYWSNRSKPVTASRPSSLQKSTSNTNFMKLTDPPSIPPESSNARMSRTMVEEDKEYVAVSELRLRDLRRLDYQFNPNEEKSILIRKHAVLFAMVINLFTYL
jgi:hypothetical protein